MGMRAESPGCRMPGVAPEPVPKTSTKLVIPAGGQFGLPAVWRASSARSGSRVICADRPPVTLKSGAAIGAVPALVYSNHSVCFPRALRLFGKTSRVCRSGLPPARTSNDCAAWIVVVPLETRTM